MWKIALAISTTAMFVGACGSSKGADPPATQPEKLTYEGDCTTAVCPAPAGGGSQKCAKGGSDDACSWSGSPDTSVGWGECALPECGDKPNIVCPPGLDILSQQCGSEVTPGHPGTCAWHSTCSPPPSNTPCGSDACGPMPEIGIVCDGGASGRLECMKTVRGCEWQPKCS